MVDLLLHVDVKGWFVALVRPFAPCGIDYVAMRPKLWVSTERVVGAAVFRRIGANVSACHQLCRDQGKK